MNWPERILLYVTALSVGGFLIFGGEAAERSRNVATAPQTPAQQPGEAAVAVPDTETTQPPEQHPESGSAGADSQFVHAVADAAGRPRIEWLVDASNRAVVVLRSASGRPVVTLSAGPEETGQVSVQQDTRRATLSVHDDGQLALVMADGENDSGIRLTSRKSGEMRLQLTSQAGGHAQMLVSDTGEPEITVGNARSGIEAMMRSDSDGAAEVAVHDQKKQLGASLSLVSSGETGLRVIGGDGTSQAVVQVFPDGLTELAAKGGESGYGPNLIRLPDGVSIVSAKSPDGHPGASLVASPDGTSIIAVSSKQGKARAELVANDQGQAGLFLTDPKGKVLEFIRPPKVATTP